MTNDEFNPITEEELQAQRESEELDRRIRRMVVRVQSGEADEEIAEDRRLEEEERAQAEEEERKERKRRSGWRWQIFSGTILTSRGMADNYRYFAAIAVMCFISIVVMFAALYADLRYSRAEQDVQLLRERSIRLQEQLHRRTTHQAIRDSLAARGIDLRDPRQKTSVLEE
ncbi:MAG: hypothetical protein II976_08190 [Alistipes sp.]|nr:hypothetical protein [Alistipes sp.]MBQ8552596.1 hypothetical protein [Alistipes sp.]MBR3886080.1 hypothetical protein [Alistipes sp.]